MEKLKYSTKVDSKENINTSYDNGDDRHDIDEVINFLIDSKQKGATHIEFSGVSDIDFNNDLEELSITTVTIEYESDDNFKKRLLEEVKKHEDNLILSEKKYQEELSRLNKKYNK